jgi:glycosyltransferase involved in cell wall biosynthesis
MFKTFEEACTKRVTYVVVTKDRSSFLKNALERMREIKKDEDELFVFDGASTDDTPDVVAQYDDLVDLYITEPDTSEGHAANKGYLLGNGRYVKEITDDDIIHPDEMERALQILDDNPDIDVLLCGGTKIRKGEKEYICVPPDVDYGADVGNIFKYGGCGVGWIIRRSAFARLGLMNPSAVSLDNDFLAQAMFNGGNVTFCRLDLYVHEIFDHSFVNSRTTRMTDDVKRIKKQYLRLSRTTRIRNATRVGLSRTPIVGWAGRLVLKVGRKMTSNSDPGPRGRHKVPPEWDGGLS